MRFWFGDTPADVVVAPGQQVQITLEMLGYEAVLVPGQRLWVWHPETGERVTDLLDGRGEPVTEIAAQSYGRIPRFRGPDEVKQVLIGQATDTLPGGEDQERHRQTLVSTDWPADLGRLSTRVTALEDQAGGDPSDPGGDYVATAHPMPWHMSGPLESKTSPHPYFNLEGRGQTITVIRAQATITAGEVSARVLTVDPDTGVETVVASVPLTVDAPVATIRPNITVSDGTGVTCAVEVPDTTEAENLTVQVMIR